MSLHVSPISLRVSLTERCQMRCRYCRPAHAVLPDPVETPLPAEWLRRIGHIHRAVGINKLRLTGGEPLLAPGIEEILRGCTDLGIPDLALTTNALRLAERAASLRDAGLQRVNISLDSLDPDTFRQITGARVVRALAGIDAALAAGLQVKLNTVVMRGVNDTHLHDLVFYALDNAVTIRFLEMMPIGPAAAEFEQLYISGSELRKSLENVFRLSELSYEKGETSRDFAVTAPDGRAGIVGLILPSSTPFCEGCRRLRLSVEGDLLGCLAQPDRESLRVALDAADEGEYEPLRDCVRRAMRIKTRPQRFRDQQDMVRVGG